MTAELLQAVLRSLEIFGLIFGAFLFAIRLGRYTQKFEDAIKAQAAANKNHDEEMKELHIELKKLNDVLSTLAVQNIRLDMHDKWIDELRHSKLLPPDGRLD